MSRVYLFVHYMQPNCEVVAKPRHPSSAADIQSGHVIMAAALISWPGYTWMLCSSAADNPPGGLGSTRWLIEQLYRYVSL